MGDILDEFYNEEFNIKLLIVINKNYLIKLI